MDDKFETRILTLERACEKCEKLSECKVSGEPATAVMDSKTHILTVYPPCIPLSEIEGVK